MNKKKLNVLSFVNYVFFILLTLIMIYPFWYVLMYSLSDPGKVSINNYYLIPDGFSLVTYKHVLRQPFLLLGYKNTAFVTATGTIISLFMTVITAYPLSREKLTGKKIYFRLILFTMLFSGGMIPTYLVIRGIGLLDTLWALIIPNAVSVYYMLIMIKFFKGIPVSLIESARIDGYDDIAILF